MRFLNDNQPNYELTYNDVFLVPSHSDIDSRLEVDLASPGPIDTHLPLVVANMNAVAGKRMAETVARRGGLAVLPQDIPLEVLADMIAYVKSRHLVFETPLTLGADNTIAEALNIIHKRAHQAIIIIDSRGRPVGIFTSSDSAGHDLFSQVGQVMSTDLISLPANLAPKAMFDKLSQQRLNVAPVLSGGKMVGVVTKKSILRSGLYQPAVDKNKRLMVGAAVGINGDVAKKVEQVLRAGADVLVIDTAHGHQQKMCAAIKKARAVSTRVPIVAGNVVTAQAVRDLAKAGADIIKVGVGPGAMCTTRMMTGVGRPQFSAVTECASAARELGKYIWADGGIRWPRDVALALAAGASSVMFGSWWAGTYESAADIQADSQGRLFKENFGMASKRAVKNRNAGQAAYDQAKRELFEEGISKSQMFLHPERPGAEDIIDHIIAGLRSSMTYAGARTIEEFAQKAVVGVQSGAGYEEGKALPASWN
ncbi:MAG TPA: GuaB1 family IMP dehydrogenase-related protein [Candidatus Saccharimonadales bacterium]|nr:GuaB1 family IMP dehydrogenase-related protein [Candidatus Saccharimonadales bacterium]